MALWKLSWQFTHCKLLMKSYDVFITLTLKECERNVTCLTYSYFLIHLIFLFLIYEFLFSFFSFQILLCTQKEIKAWINLCSSLLIYVLPIALAKSSATKNLVFTLLRLLFYMNHMLDRHLSVSVHQHQLIILVI
jgi:hypothetical protein